MMDLNLNPLKINENELHLWYAAPNKIKNPDLLQKYLSILNAEEAVQQKRFHFERHRHQYLITRALVRSLLSRYTGINPENLTFIKNDFGRPQLISEQRVHPIFFNLSHTEGLIVCGIALGREVGVDVEDITRGGDLIQIADRFFSPSEVKDLHKVPEKEQENRFFDYWTLKEAYIKARGMGLSIPLEQFSYHLSDTHTNISISIDPRQDDTSDRWIFSQWSIQPNFKVSVCLEKTIYPVTVMNIESIPFDQDIAIKPTCFRRSEGWQ